MTPSTGPRPCSDSSYQARDGDKHVISLTRRSLVNLLTPPRPGTGNLDAPNWTNSSNAEVQ